MLKKELIAGPSCLTAAADDEPVFLLRAHDELAPEVVRYWAQLYGMSKSAAGLMTTKSVTKRSEAFDCAMAMKQWKEEHPDGK
jgi:hypothetical protein